MNKSRRRYSIQEKLDILYEADQYGSAHIQSTYEVSPSILFRWEKDLKKSKARQAAIKKHEDAQVVESMKAEIEQLKSIIANQTAVIPKTEKKPLVSKLATNTKADELYRLVASLIVQDLLNEFDEEPGHNQMLDEG